MLDAQTKAALSKAFAELAKAVPEVKDLWTDMSMNANPERGEIKTGPGQASSGAGAEKMIGDYSEPAPQVALAQAYKQFNSLLSDFPTIKAQLNDVTGALSFMLTKSVAKGRTVEQVAKSLETARINLAVLKATKGDATAIAKAEKAIARYTAEQELLRSLTGLSLADAMKAIGGITAKAEEEEDEHVEINVTEEEKEKAEKAGYAKAAQDLTSFLDAFAKGDEAAMSKALEAAPETVKQSFTAIKSLFVKKANDTHGADGKFGEKGDATGAPKDEEKEKMKSRLAELTKEVDTISKALGNQSTGAGTPPNLSGAGAETVRDRVVKALTDGEFTNGADITAQSLLQQYDMVQSGKLGKEVFDRNLSLAPPSVKAMFAVN